MKMMSLIAACTICGMAWLPPMVQASPRQEFLYRGTKDGHILVYRVGSRGELTPLPELTQRAGTYHLRLHVTGKGKYLYAGQRLDLSKNEPAVWDNPTESEGPSVLRVYRIGADGSLTPTHTVNLPQTIGTFTPHPDGSLIWMSFFTAKTVILPLRADGTPGTPRPLPHVASGLGILDGDPLSYSLPAGGDVGGRLNVDTVNMQGTYLWHFYIQSGHDHRYDCVNRFRILPGGRLRQSPLTGREGNTADWMGSAYSDADGKAAEDDPGPIYFFDRDTAFVQGQNCTYVCRQVKGNLKPGKPHVLPSFGPPASPRTFAQLQAWMPRLRSVYAWHPNGQVFISYRVTRPGQVIPVKTWGKAGLLATDQTTHRLYEFTPGKATIHALTVYQAEPNGKVTRLLPPRDTDIAPDDPLIFVTPAR